MSTFIRISTDGNRPAFLATIWDLREQGVPFLWLVSDGKMGRAYCSSRIAIQRLTERGSTGAFIICRERDIELVKLITRGRVRILNSRLV
jgi:hypothetical protein